jgi:predicted secreted protein
MSQIIGHGSQLELDTTVGATGAAGDTWTTIAGVESIDFGSNKIDTIDTTDMGTTGTARTYISGLEDPGDVSVKINVKAADTSQAALRTAKGTGAIQYFKAVYPGNVASVAFTGIITSIDMAIPNDKLPTWTVKIKISAAPAYLNA